MEKKVGAFEAKTYLPKLLEAVLHGDKITITRRGEAIAMLVPIRQAAKADVKSAIANFRKWRQGITWGKGMSTEKAKTEGRK